MFNSSQYSNNVYYIHYPHLTVIDSIGRPTSGILEGRMTYLGQYDECIAINGPSFAGKYCIAHIQLPPYFTHVLNVSTHIEV